MEIDGVIAYVVLEYEDWTTVDPLVMPESDGCLHLYWSKADAQNNHPGSNIQEIVLFCGGLH